MSFTREDVEIQLRLGEDSRWEFKQVEFRRGRLTGPLKKDLADEIAAFANTDGGGVLLCGVTDAGEVQRLSRDQMAALEEVVTALCHDTIKPPINPEIRRLEVTDSKLIVLVNVSSGYDVHKSSGGYFHRVGSSKREMTSDQLLRLAQRRGQSRIRSFDGQPVLNTGFNTLEKAIWESLLSEEGATDPRAALERMDLLVSDENQTLRASVAGILLCCESPEKWLPNACITAVRYRGQDRASGQIDEQTVTGPLHHQIANAVGFAVRNMEEAPQYSERALFEAVVNAVVHRDYTIRGSWIRLSIFANRLEIQSPGVLPNGMTVENLGQRPSARNEVLVSILRRVPVRGIPGGSGREYLIERRGEGISIIQRETLELSGQPAKFELIDGADLRLTLPIALRHTGGVKHQK